MSRPLTTANELAPTLRETSLERWEQQERMASLAGWMARWLMGRPERVMRFRWITEVWA